MSYLSALPALRFFEYRLIRCEAIEAIRYLAFLNFKAAEFMQ